MRRVRGVGPRLLLAAIVAAALGSTLVSVSQFAASRDVTLGTPALAADGNPIDIQAQKVTQGGAVLGRVLVDGAPVIEYLVNAGWYDGYERALIAAGNLRKVLDAGAASHHFRAGRVQDYEAVMADGEKIITVDPADAQYNSTPAVRLARNWADNIANAVALAEQRVAPPPPEPELSIEAERTQIGDNTVGDVLIDDRIVIRVWKGIDGQSPFDRSKAIAKRIRDSVEDGYGPTDLAVGEQKNRTALLAGDKLIAYVDPYHAQLNNSTEDNLARIWGANIAEALEAAGVESTRPVAEPEPVGPGPGPGPGPVEQYDDAWYQERYGDKWVPILSVPDGIRIGAARVNGPKNDLRLVQAVAQIETPWHDTLEIDIYVPISTKRPGKFLSRVQGVGVTALADYDLTDDGKPKKSKKNYSIFDPPGGKAKPKKKKGLLDIF
ncbi:MAG: hypothetical protein PVH68_07090 [Armatimonadota bacterium]